MLLRDLVTRLTFKVDSEPLRGLDRHISSLKKTAVGLGTAFVGTQAIRRGGWLGELELQLKSLAGGEGPMAQLRKAMDDLPPIFSKREAMEGLVGALQQGFGVNEVIKMMHESARLTARTKEGLDTLLPRFARLVKSGGMVEFLTSLGLLDEKTERSLLKVTDKINQGAGLMSRDMTRALGDVFRAMIDSHGDTLDKELVERSQLSVLKVERRWTDMWDTVSRLGAETLKPLLDWTADIVEEVDKMAKAYGGMEKVIQRVFNFGAGGPDTPKPEAKVELPEGAMGSAYKVGPNGLPIGVRPGWYGFLQMLGLKPLDTQEGTPPPSEGLGRPNPLQEVDPKTGQPLSMNFGDIHITVPGAGDREAVAQAVYDKFADEMRRTANDHIPNLEVTG